MSPSEIQQICAILNHFGSGGVPHASVENYEYFEKEYVQECIGKAVDQLNQLNVKIDSMYS